jgi:acyl-CoA synthetase (AMP-forming)/AMP-acid ligase II
MQSVTYMLHGKFISYPLSILIYFSGNPIFSACIRNFRKLRAQNSTVVSINVSMATSVPCLLLERLQKNASKYPTKTAITFLASGPDGGRIESKLTYMELCAEVKDVSFRLHSEGLQPGDRAVLVYPPSLEYMIAFLACLTSGIVAVPVFPPNPTRRDTLTMFTSIVNSSRATHALTSTSYNHAKQLASIKSMFSISNRKYGSWPENLVWIATNDKKKCQSKVNFPIRSSSDLAFLQYTSGSTSEPKGVMISHGNLAHNLMIITNELKALDDTVVVSWLPQYHDMGLIGSYLGVLYCGGSGYYMSPLAFLQRPMQWIEAISKYKATHIQAPNFAFKLSARKFQPTSSPIDLSCIRHAINAAEPVTKESIDSFVATFGPHGFSETVMFPTYGLAEHTVFVCSGGEQRLTVDKTELEINRKIIETSSKDGSTQLIGCGYPSRQGVDVRIVDHETNSELEENSVGEIWINSASKALGYFEKPDETEKDFHARLKGVSQSTYLRTGDLGFFHRKELFICGRIKDLIIIGGRNYYPQDLEATAEAALAEVRPGCSAAFTVDPASENGEEVAMVLELREIPKEVEAFCSPLVERIKAVIMQEHSLSLADIVLLKPKSIPKTTSGKIARSWCRNAYMSNTLHAVYRQNYQLKPATTDDTNDAVDENYIEALRKLDRKEILSKLKEDIVKIGGTTSEAIAENVPISTMLDSISITQFKGRIESHYGVSKLSDEYLFRESCTLIKIAEIVKLGNAPDDGENVGSAAEPTHQSTGGLAGALGCPPGVVCVIL